MTDEELLDDEACDSDDGLVDRHGNRLSAGDDRDSAAEKLARYRSRPDGAAIGPQALAIDEDLARLRTLLVVDHHRRVQSVDQVWEGVRVLIHHALLAPRGGQAEHHAGRLLGHQPLVLHEVLLQVQPKSQGQLAGLVSRKLLSLEGVPGHQVPVGHRIELYRSAE
ncbi:MAG: hypothetical protein NTY19_00725 [Planctomycetota bacterium]|nr:hypothetical protein [Planctomycetota bacterium]